MDGLSLGTAKILGADWISSALVRRPRVGPTEEDFIDAPDGTTARNQCPGASSARSRVGRPAPNRIRLKCSGALLGIVPLVPEGNPLMSEEHVGKSCVLFEQYRLEFCVNCRVSRFERRTWRAEHYLAYYMLTCWDGSNSGSMPVLLSWNNNTCPQVIFRVLGLYTRLSELGIIGPAFGRLLGNYYAHCAHYGKFNRKIFSYKSKFGINPLIEELEQHYPESHVAFFGEYLKLLGAIGWNYDGTDERYGFPAPPVFPRHALLITRIPWDIGDADKLYVKWSSCVPAA
ncbi:hypothetical protein DL768_010630 [Monosporascus sp. mg162]|nr:hypothetical protein DL768_010630 [Monosporascus sp. mg162]